MDRIKVANELLKLAKNIMSEERRLVDSIRNGDRVTIITRHGTKMTGRAVMKGPAGWVLNLGGAHGTPGIATDENTIKVVPSKKANVNVVASPEVERAYQQKLAIVERQVDLLNKSLEKEKSEFKKDSDNFGHVGNLGHVSELLEEINLFLR
jgi:hypothetical protein